MTKKLSRIIHKNLTVILFFVFSILIEMIAVYSIEKNPFISHPWIGLGALITVSGIMVMIKSEQTRLIIGLIFLILQSVFCMIMAVLYDMAGQYFDFGMLNLRNDAFGILENIPMDFVTFYTAFFFCMIFAVVTLRRRRRQLDTKAHAEITSAKTVTDTKSKKDQQGSSTPDTEKKSKSAGKENRNRIIAGAVIAIAGICMNATAIYQTNKNRSSFYDNLRYSTDKSVYSAYGINGNLINEFAGGLIFNEKQVMADEKVEDFIYAEVSEPTEYFGISKGNNVVVVLVESLEWFGMLKNDILPNALPLTDEQYAELFPNLTAFYNDSVVMSDFHSKRRPDISETLSILGSYPTRGYINYDYYEEEIPQTIPNILRTLYDDRYVINSYHNGRKNFYNRSTVHETYGFTHFYSAEEMYDISDQLIADGVTDKEIMHDYMNEGERNLDSEMIELCKDMMFPTDKPFFTYITSITMHGMFYDRNNLAEHKEKLLSVYADRKGTAEEDLLINYLSTVMEFDKALGVMMDDLRDKGLLDHTTIILFGDHNCYYQELSNYVKDIYDYDTKMDYSDLYLVPLMIYDEKLGHQVIDKFTCTADIAPTILDLLGIRYYSNMYYGHSVFADEESVIYSRASSFFVDGGLVAKSLSSPLYKQAVTQTVTGKISVKRGSILVDKLEYCDQIFEGEYFSDPENEQTFKNNMLNINQDR